jgi:hypothetical protein
MLKKEKKRGIPWYLLCFTEKNHEKIMIITVPVIIDAGFIRYLFVR